MWTKKYKIALWLFLISVCIFALIMNFGMRQFGGFDQSALIDIAYRIWLGQRSYLDFFAPTPPWFNVGAGFCFSLFGVKFQSLIIGFALYSVLLFLWIFFLASKIFKNDKDSLLISTSAISGSAVFVSYWWYNPLTVLAGIVVFLSTVALLRDSRSKVFWLSLFSSYILIAGLKPNLAALILLISFLILFYRNKKEIIFFTSAAAVVFIVICWTQNISIIQMLRAYIDISGRGTPNREIFTQDILSESSTAVISCIFFVLEILIYFYRTGDLLTKVKSQKKLVSLILFLTFASILKEKYIIFFSLLSIQAWISIKDVSTKRWLKIFSQLFILSVVTQIIFDSIDYHILLQYFFLGYILWFILVILWRQPPTIEVYCIASILIGLFSFYTNAEIRLTDGSLILLPILVITSRNTEENRAHTSILNLLPIFIAVSIFGGATRYRVEGIGWPYSKINTPIQAQFFQGLLASPELQETIDLVAAVLSKIPQEQWPQIWFGNRLQFLYPVFNIPPQQQLPSWFHRGVTYSSAQEDKIFKKFKDSKLKILIMRKNDPAEFPQKLKNWIIENYQLKSYKNIEVFSLR